MCAFQPAALGHDVWDRMCLGYLRTITGPGLQAAAPGGPELRSLGRELLAVGQKKQVTLLIFWVDFVMPQLVFFFLEENSVGWRSSIQFCLAKISLPLGMFPCSNNNPHLSRISI